MPLLDMQVRFRELGRIRAGEKGPKGEPKKRTTWRLTSASRKLLEIAQREYGGELREWANAPNDGMWELLTDSAELDVMIPPVSEASTLLSQNYELWSGGGCKRRCDSVTQANGKPCACNPEARECSPVTRMSVMLPRIPDVGVWRLDSSGINAALELPGTFGLLVQAANGNFLPASLRLEQRVSKKDGEPPRRFVVPVLEMPYADVGQLAQAASTGNPILLGPSFANGRPQLPPATIAPAREPLHGEKPEFGERPALPASSSAAPMPASEEPTAVAPDAGAEPAPKLATPARKKKLDVLVGTLRDGGHINNEQLWRAMGREPILREEDGALHWSDLRELLTNDEASQLIDRLSKLEQRVKDNDSPFQAPASVGQ